MRSSQRIFHPLFVTALTLCFFAPLSPTRAQKTIRPPREAKPLIQKV
jgi:hypothetical protein